MRRLAILPRRKIKNSNGFKKKSSNFSNLFYQHYAPIIPESYECHNLPAINDLQNCDETYERSRA